MQSFRVTVLSTWGKSPLCPLSCHSFILQFCLTQVHFAGATDCPNFGVPRGFQSQGGSLICMLTCLHTVNLRVIFGATPAFLTFQTSVMQAAEGRQ